MSTQPLAVIRRSHLILGLVFLAAATALAHSNDDAVLQRMKKDIFFLASPECEGRGVGTKGIDLAADYIANELKNAGLKPGAKDGSYFQPFTVAQGQPVIVATNTLTFKGPQGQTTELVLDKDFKVQPMAATGKVEAPVVFAGYGLSVPEAKYDDFGGVDVAGKIVVVIRRVPRYDSKLPPFAGDKDAHVGLESKIANCEIHKAAAVLFINDQGQAKEGDNFAVYTDVAAASVPVLQLRRAVLDTMLESGNKTTLTDLEKAIDEDLKPRSAPIAGWTASLQTNVVRAGFPCKNIIGVLEGAGPLADETVVIGAHYDHLGFGGFGSLAKSPSTKQIHPGADDNGSGTTSVIEMARHFGAMKERQGRRLVFMLFSGEERGLLGSKYYCNKEPLFPLEKTVAMINLDMVGRLGEGEKKPTLNAEGLGSGKDFDKLVEKKNADFGFNLQLSKAIIPYSDHASFSSKKVPVIFLWTGKHEDYHRPTDTADKINIAGMAKIASFAEKFVAYFMTLEKRPEYIAYAEKSAGPGAGPMGPRMRIGIVYGDDTNKGVLLDSVTEGGPAGKAGIKAGDRIVSIAGLPTPNVNTYMAVMQKQKANMPLEITVSRDGKELKLSVTPE
jgi:hypothetical protein